MQLLENKTQTTPKQTENTYQHTHNNLWRCHTPPPGNYLISSKHSQKHHQLRNCSSARSRTSKDNYNKHKHTSAPLLPLPSPGTASAPTCSWEVDLR